MDRINKSDRVKADFPIITLRNQNQVGMFDSIHNETLA